MLKKASLVVLVSVIAIVVASLNQPVTPVRSIAWGQPEQTLQDDNQTCQSFSQTGFSVCGRFLAFWYKYGGVQVFGYPVGMPLKETSSANGKEYLVQYFERAVFELHPENQPPYDVLLSQLGREKYQRLYPHGTSGAGVGVVGDPQPEMNVSKQLQPGIYVRLMRESQAAITGLYTGNCGLEMTWVLQIENRSNTPFVATLNTGNLRMLDSTGKSYSPTRRCGSAPVAPYSGSFGQPNRLGPGESQRGTVAFQVQDIPASASYFQLEVSFSGAPIHFRYILP